jgi:predicted Zn-dependent protease
MFEEALVQFKRLSEVTPDSPEAPQGLAETLLRLGRLDEAEAVTRNASERFPDSAELTVLTARSLLRRGNVARAIELLTPLGYGRDDAAANALGWLATAELLRGQPRHAVGAAERALALDPSSRVATYAMAQALDALGDPAAIAWQRRARERR